MDKTTSELIVQEAGETSMPKHWRIKKWVVTAHCTKCDHSVTKHHTCRAEELEHRVWHIDYCPACKQWSCTHTAEEQKQP